MRLAIFMSLLTLLVTACGTTTPPTLFVMEVTRVVTVVVTADANEATTNQNQAAIVTNPTATPSAAPPANNTAPTITPTPDIFPTPARGQVFLAVQDFERGRMFWLEPVGQIWVAFTDEAGNQIWSVHADTFEEGMVERDPTLSPPSNDVQQPVRGFGKLWRENDAIRETLGWATDAETGYITRYEFHAGGTVQDDEYIWAPGYHLLETLDQQVLRFNEPPPEGGERTWQVVENETP